MSQNLFLIDEYSRETYTRMDRTMLMSQAKEIMRGILRFIDFQINYNDMEKIDIEKIET